MVVAEMNQTLLLKQLGAVTVEQCWEWCNGQLYLDYAFPYVVILVSMASIYAFPKKEKEKLTYTIVRCAFHWMIWITCLFMIWTWK